MANIAIVFGEILPHNKQEYITQRVESLNGALIYSPAENSWLSEATPQVLIPTSGTYTEKAKIAPKVDLNTLPENQGAVIRASRNCMLKEVKDFSPLTEGETVEAQLASYLEEDWCGFDKGTIILKEQTNKALTYYVYPDLKADVENGQLVMNDKTYWQPPAMVMLDDSDDDGFGQVARDLATGLVGEAPFPLNVIGAELLSAFWPDGSDSAADWKEMYERLQTIVRNELARGRIETDKGKLAGVIDYLNITYKNNKNQGKSSEELLADLNPQYQILYGIVGDLKVTGTDTADADTSADALANYMIAVGVQIAIAQERAMHGESTADITSLATQASAYARKAAKNVMKLRLGQISEVHVKKKQGNGVGGSIWNDWTAWFTDSNNGYHKKFHGHSDDGEPRWVVVDANKAHDEYVQKITNQTQNTLQKQVYDVCDKWEQLENNPLPSVQEASPVEA